MIRKCFTVNPNRTIEEINSYEVLLKDGIYQGVEIFYPYLKTKEQQEIYLSGIKSYLKYNPEMVCHLPYGKANNLASYENLEVIMERYYNAIDFASRVGCKKLTLHPGEYDGTISKSDALNLMISNIKKLCLYAAKYDMTVMLENLIGEIEFMKTPEDYLEYKQMINEPNLKMIFDVAHYHTAHIKENKDIVRFITIIGDDLYHLHISDNDGTRDAHGPIGSGTIDFKTYFKALKLMNYEGLYSSEVLFNTPNDLLNTANNMDDCLK